MIPKYRYHPLVSVFTDVIVVAIGQRTGLSTRVEALRASALANGSVLEIREKAVSVAAYKFEIEALDCGTAQAIVLLTEPYTDPEPFAGEISIKFGLPVLWMSVHSFPAFSDEYDAAIRKFSANGIEMMFGPDDHPDRGYFSAVMAALSPVAVKPLPTDD